jgi:esterase
MTSYLDQFNYQIITGDGTSLKKEQTHHSSYTHRFVFLHGLMGFGLNWRQIASSLGPHCVSLLLDQRGHGKSFKPLHGYSPEDYSQDLENIRQELQWSHFILVGHSMGGRNALWYAHQFPQRVTKLVIEDIGPEAKPEAITYYSQLLESIPTPFPSKREAKEWLLNDFLRTPFGRRGGLTLGHYLYANMIETPSGQGDWRFSKKAILESIEKGRGQNHWSLWDELSMPILLVRGELSKDLSAEVYHEMLRRQPLCQGVVLEGAGHWAHFDRAQEFIDHMIRFV